MNSALKKLGRQYLLTLYALSFTLVCAVFIVNQLLLQLVPTISADWALLLSLLATFTLSCILSLVIRYVFTLPLHMVAQAILYISPGTVGLSPPAIEHMTVGRSSTQLLITELYNLVRSQNAASTTSELTSQVLDKLSYPLFFLDSNSVITFINTKAAELLSGNKETFIGRAISDVLRMEQDGTIIIDDWLATAKQEKIHDEKLWSGVRYSNAMHQQYYFDVVASYHKADPSGVDTTIALIDTSSNHEGDDLKVDFVAMAAHELRAPITVIRGYMEVFEDEVGKTLTDEQRLFMQKMIVSANQLATFVNNILNASRADHGNLKINMEKHNWTQLIKQIYDEALIRAHAHDHKLHMTIAANLPDVAVDPFSINEVVTNLVDNAIKYSSPDSMIEITVRMTEENMIETTVTDQGIGIPDSLVNKLFTKYYRSHRSKEEFGGMGLGLYLSKTIVEAHGGQIWVRSTEGQGSTFGFTIPRYEDVAEQLQKHDNLNEVTRGNHGWIRNHSLYRR